MTKSLPKSSTLQNKQYNVLHIWNTYLPLLLFMCVIVLLIVIVLLELSDLNFF